MLPLILTRSRKVSNRTYADHLLKTAEKEWSHILIICQCIALRHMLPEISTGTKTRPSNVNLPHTKSRCTLISRLHKDDSMKIGIAGGTGGMGEGFSLRWCRKHDVIVGSRDAQKAREAAENYSKVAKQTYGDIAGSISGNDNISLANDIDVFILSIPYESIEDTCGKLTGKLRDDCIVVSPIVPMTRTDAGFVYIPMEQGKEPAAEMVADRLPPRSRVVSAFHTISES
ncbi:MAG TPA: NAD(P)-binding domain-containing protein, partial [Nitrososphaeraceae archaeon]|nr:NAD(P)-binding domain-containing protein [Nitrososphaeraceae archaeon]